MDPEFWHQRWESQQIHFHQRQINPLLQKYWSRLSLSPTARVLVPLCGKSLDMLWLAEQGHAVTGVELNRQAVEAFFSDNDLLPRYQRRGALDSYRFAQIELLCGDLFELSDEPLGGFEAIYDRAALIALPQAMRQRYVEQLKSRLKVDGQLLLITLEYPAELRQGPPFSVEQAHIESLFGDGFEVQRLAEEQLCEQSDDFSRRGLLGSSLGRGGLSNLP